jgi:prepilin-type N-terminal cleavage/methylation domain-containing protein
MRLSEHGFSLLEVMAAVAVVAIVFSTLARVASQGLHSEGLSKRRLEASLLADHAVSDLELNAAAGQVPAQGLSETEDGFYRISVEVRRFPVLDVIPVPSDTIGEPNREPEDAEPIWAQEIKVTVSWPEGFSEGSVKRMTYTVDLSGLGDALAESGLQDGPS